MGLTSTCWCLFQLNLPIMNRMPASLDLAASVPAQPPLMGNVDPSKIDEIRRTVYVGNLNSQVGGALPPIHTATSSVSSLLISVPPLCLHRPLLRSSCWSSSSKWGTSSLCAWPATRPSRHASPLWSSWSRIPSPEH